MILGQPTCLYGTTIPKGTTQSARRLISNVANAFRSSSTKDPAVWRAIWRYNVPLRIKLFGRRDAVGIRRQGLLLRVFPVSLCPVVFVFMSKR